MIARCGGGSNRQFFLKKSLSLKVALSAKPGERRGFPSAMLGLALATLDVRALDVKNCMTL